MTATLNGGAAAALTPRGTKAKLAKPFPIRVRLLSAGADVAHPDYYRQLRPEPIDVIANWELNYNLGCVVKYAARAGRKDSAPAISDLKKARHYLLHEIARLERLERKR